MDQVVTFATAVVESRHSTNHRPARILRSMKSDTRELVCLAAILVLTSGSPCLAEDKAEGLTFQAVSEILRQSCGECHAGGSEEGGFALAQVGAEDSLRSNFQRWQKMLQRITDRSMPPADGEPLTEDLRKQLVA
jgi:uncharacterized membrane protein